MTGFDWFALSVRSRHEFVTRDELMRKGFKPSAFGQKLQQWRDRKNWSNFRLSVTSSST
jgi:hypothetical protein